KCTKVEKKLYPKKHLEYLKWLLKHYPYFKNPGKFFNSLCKYEKQKHQGEGNWDLVDCNKIQQQNSKWHLDTFLIKLPSWDLNYFQPGMIADKSKIYPMIHIKDDGTYDPDHANAARKIQDNCKNSSNCEMMDVCTEFKTGI
ncbi:hypothetical protein, partial [Campylobacter portucalensis]|uniref:hypothetical protein n=1 Tax=Campylobacter portucalensis TaxID=2608384 RepID=UPI0018A6B0DD